MTAHQSKVHRVGEWAKLRATSREIAEAIFEVADYDERLAEEIWQQQGSDDVLLRAFDKTDKEVLIWDNKTVERKNV